MAEPQRPLFYERRTYRRRRLADLARLTPVAGLILLMVVPLLWNRGPDGTATSRAILWIFGVWAALVVIAAWLSARRLDTDLGTAGGGDGALRLSLDQRARVARSTAGPAAPAPARPPDAEAAPDTGRDSGSDGATDTGPGGGRG